MKQVAAEMDAIGQREGEAYPDNRGWQIRVMPIREFATGELTRQYTLLLMGAVGFVLLSVGVYGVMSYAVSAFTLIGMGIGLPLAFG